MTKEATKNPHAADCKQREIKPSIQVVVKPAVDIIKDHLFMSKRKDKHV